MRLPPSQQPPSAAPKSAHQLPNPALPEHEQQFRDDFKQQAQHPQAFHALMQSVFGTTYNRSKAEQLRSRALNNDFSWLPQVQFVPAKSLGVALGAYSTANQTIYLHEALHDAPQLAARTYLEEVGHHLDAMLNTQDTPGDEGEHFRRRLEGETLSAAQVEAIKQDNDHGNIMVDGKRVEVEFWNPLAMLGSLFGGLAKMAGSLIGKVLSVTKVIGSIAAGIGNVLKSILPIGKKILEAVTKIGEAAQQIANALNPLSSFLNANQQAEDPDPSKPGEAKKGHAAQAATRPSAHNAAR